MKSINRFVSILISGAAIFAMMPISPVEAVCGEIRSQGYRFYCLIDGDLKPDWLNCIDGENGNGWPCCIGPNKVDECAAYSLAPTATPTPTIDPANPLADPFAAPRKEFFDMVDPLLVGGGKTILEEVESDYASILRSPGGVVSRALVFIFPLAGLLLFFMLVWGGFEMLIGAPTKKSMESGRQRVTAAIVGFLLLFSSYWIWQIIEIVFGVKIL